MRWLIDGKEEQGFKHWLERKVLWPAQKGLKVTWNFPRRLIRFLIRLFHYLPILWRDQDFDYAYILHMLHFKLKRTRKHIAKHKVIANWPAVAQQIWIAEKMIQAHFESKWTEVEQAAHDQKYGELVQNFIKDHELDSKFGESYKCDSYRELAREQGLEKQEREQQKAIWELHSQREQTNLDNLFIHLRKHIEDWWD